jgi:hypothetical protein
MEKEVFTLIKTQYIIIIHQAAIPVPLSPKTPLMPSATYLLMVIRNAGGLITAQIWCTTRYCSSGSYKPLGFRVLSSSG